MPAIFFEVGIFTKEEVIAWQFQKNTYEIYRHTPFTAIDETFKIFFSSFSYHFKVLMPMNAPLSASNIQKLVMET